MILRTVIKLALFSLFAAFGTSACATHRSAFIPFEAYKAGSVATQTLHVTNESGWEILLILKKPNGADVEVSKKIEAVENDISGGPSVPMGPHHGIRLLLTVTQNTKNQQILIRRKEITEEPLKGPTMLHIDGIRLSSGEYVVTAQTLEDDPRLEGINVGLSVGTTWK